MAEGHGYGHGYGCIEAHGTFEAVAGFGYLGRTSRPNSPHHLYRLLPSTVSLFTLEDLQHPASLFDQVFHGFLRTPSKPGPTGSTTQPG